MDDENKKIVDRYTDAIINHADGYGEVARDFVRNMLIQFGERLIGELPDLERYKDDGWTDNQKLWAEAIWDTKKHLLSVLKD